MDGPNLIVREVGKGLDTYGYLVLLSLPVWISSMDSQNLLPELKSQFLYFLAM